MAKHRTSSMSRSKTKRHNRRHRGRPRRHNSTLGAFSTESSSQETSQSRSRRGWTLSPLERSGKRSGQRCLLKQRSRQASKSLAQEELPGIGSPCTSRRGHMRESRCATSGQGGQTKQLGQLTHVIAERFSTSLQICTDTLHHQTVGAAERTQCKTARCAKATYAPSVEGNWGFASDANLWQDQQPQWPREGTARIAEGVMHERPPPGDADNEDEGLTCSPKATTVTVNLGIWSNEVARFGKLTEGIDWPGPELRESILNGTALEDFVQSQYIIPQAEPSQPGRVARSASRGLGRTPPHWLCICPGCASAQAVLILK
jgi:hypothetical protein